jgi:mono/diheme cytochrome c family protein
LQRITPFVLGTAALISMGSFLTSVPVRAQHQTGNAAAGLHFTETWCSGCHPVELRAARTGAIAPDFITIANRPTTTANSLAGYLDSNHQLMPNFQLTHDEADDVIAYIMSLKDPNHK